jgi:hypothetical protein
LQICCHTATNFLKRPVYGQKLVAACGSKMPNPLFFQTKTGDLSYINAINLAETVL